MRWRTTCATHRSALHDFVDNRAGYDPGTGRDLAAALDHLDRCRDCEQELAATALVIAALRRLADDVARAEPSPDAWLRLVDRLDRPRARRALLTSPLAGLALSAGLVVAIVVPQFGLDVGQSAVDVEGPPYAATAEALIEEQRWLRERTQLGTRTQAIATTTTTVTTTVRQRDRLGPDGVQFTGPEPHYDAPPGRQH